MPRMLLVVSGTPHRLRFVKDRTVCSPVKSVHVPKNFIMYNTMNMALICLKHKLPLDNPNIGYLLLPLTPPQMGVTYSVLGWGRMYSEGPLSSEILQLEVALMDTKKCLSHFKYFRPGMLCAGKDNSTIDADPCSGDIGAPVIWNGVVVGIVSYPLGCGSDILPSIYTDVHSGLKWITETAYASLAEGLRPLLVMVLSSLGVLLTL
ncbi:trypsin alpha-3 isoform X2 [Drosophila kikkawai]|nr:trypsin eta isoform X3 [Drosophila kikkawai]